MRSSPNSSAGVAPQATSSTELRGNVLGALFASTRMHETADQFAGRIGCGNRHRLNRLLRRTGLPGYRTLSTFRRLLALRDAAAAHGCSLCAETLRAGLDPAWAYRAFRRVCGTPWTEARLLSYEELIAMMINNRVSLALSDSPERTIGRFSAPRLDLIGQRASHLAHTSQTSLS